MFLMIVLHRKQFFEKIITGQRQQLIVLNTFLDSLGHSGLKNLGLLPGTGLECFQSPQDAVAVQLVVYSSSNQPFLFTTSCMAMAMVSKAIYICAAYLLFSGVAECRQVGLTYQVANSIEVRASSIFEPQICNFEF